MDRWHATVAEWVAQWPIFDVFTRETGYERGTRLWMLWWSQEAADNQLKVTVEAISKDARVLQQQKSRRLGGIKGGSKGGSTDSKG